MLRTVKMYCFEKVATFLRILMLFGVGGRDFDVELLSDSNLFLKIYYLCAFETLVNCKSLRQLLKKRQSIV